MVDYGILGNLDDEDSFKWVVEEIWKVLLRFSKSDNLILL